MLLRVSTATETTGSATEGGSRTKGAAGAHSVAPARAALSPITATMSPATAPSTSECCPARTRRIRPIRSLRRAPTSSTASPFRIFPEYTRRYVSRPVAVEFTLNTSAANGAAGSAGRSCSAPSRVPRTAGDIQRRGQIGNDGLQQRLDPAVAVGRTAQHHDALTGTGQIAQRGGQRPCGDRRLRAELLQRHRMEFRHGLRQQPTTPKCLFPQVVRHLPLLVRALTVGPDQRPHTQQIHHSGEPVLLPDGQLDHQRDRVQPLAYRRDRRVEVGPGTVQLVDEGDPGHPVPIGLPPHRLALRFDPRDGVEHRDRAVEHPQRALHLVGEVDVARGVDQVDPVTVPVTAHRRGKDGDAAVAFLGIEVGDGRTVMDLAPLVGGAGEVEDPFGDGGLAGIDVGEDAQIANAGQCTGELTVQFGTHGPWPFG